MIRPFFASSSKCSHVAQCGTRFELAISTLGASRCVLNTATGLPDWTSSVSSSSRFFSDSRIASNASQERAACPRPPYTTRSWGRSATSGSRLFWIMRYGASVSHDLQVSFVPRGARTVRGPDIGFSFGDQGSSWSQSSFPIDLFLLTIPCTKLSVLCSLHLLFLNKKPSGHYSRKASHPPF